MSYLQDGHVDKCFYERSKVKYLVGKEPEKKTTFLVQSSDSYLTIISGNKQNEYLERSKSSFLDTSRSKSSFLQTNGVKFSQGFVNSDDKESYFRKGTETTKDKLHLIFKGESQFLDFDFAKRLEIDAMDRVEEDTAHHIDEDMAERLEESSGESSDSGEEDFSHVYDGSMAKLLPPHWSFSRGTYRDALTGQTQVQRPEIPERFEVFDFDEPELKLMIARYVDPKKGKSSRLVLAEIVKREKEEGEIHRSRLQGEALEALRVWKHEKQKAMVHDEERLRYADKSERQKQYMQLLDDKGAEARKRAAQSNLDSKILAREFEMKAKVDARMERERGHRDRAEEERIEANERARTKEAATRQAAVELRGEALRRKLEDEDRMADELRRRQIRKENERRRQAAQVSRERAARSRNVAVRRRQDASRRSERLRDEAKIREDAYERLEDSRFEANEAAEEEERERLRKVAVETASSALLRLLEDYETGIDVRLVASKYEGKYRTPWKSQQWFGTTNMQDIIDDTSIFKSNIEVLGYGDSARLLHRKYWQRLAVISESESDILDALRKFSNISAVISSFKKEVPSISSAEKSSRWEAGKAANGKIYYIDHHTKKTTWHDPRPLPSGWRSAKTKAGKTYYIDDNSRRTSFTHPLGALLPTHSGGSVGGVSTGLSVSDRRRAEDEALRKKKEAIAKARRTVLNLLDVYPCGLRISKLRSEYSQSQGSPFPLKAFGESNLRRAIETDSELMLKVIIIGLGAEMRVVIRETYDTLCALTTDNAQVLNALEESKTLEEAANYLMRKMMAEEQSGGPSVFDEKQDDSDLQIEGLDWDSDSEEEDPLPAGWEMKVTAAGKRYYIDHNTKKTSWTRPKSTASTATAAFSGSSYGATTSSYSTGKRPALPPGWVAKRNPNGRVYFIDHNTKKTSWVRPLPPGFQERRTAAGKTYYIDDVTKTTQWEDPRKTIPLVF